MSARSWALFAAISLLWGVPYLLIKLAVEELSPAVVAFGRVAIAAAVLVPFALRRGAFRGLRARWPWLLAFAVVEMAIPFPLIAFGEQHVSSSLAAILIAALPIAVATVALRLDPEERASGTRLAGLAVGFAGVLALLGIDVAGSPDELLGAAAILVATVGYAFGTMIVKHRLAGIDPIGPVTAALLLASALLLGPSLATAPEALPSAGVVAAMLALGVASTAAAFMCFFALIADVGPARASVIAYVNPAVAVLLGVSVLGEDLGAGAVAGLLLILAGSWLSTRPGPPRPRARPSSAGLRWAYRSR